MKLDGIKELYDNDDIRGVEELEGVDELEGVKELHGEKHEAPINESKSLKEDAYDGKGPTIYVNSRAVIKVNDNEDWEGSKYFNDLNYYGPFVPKEEFIVGIKDETDSPMSYKALCDYLLSNEDNIYHLKFKRGLKEDIEDVTINTEDETMTMTTKEDGGVVVETSPREEINFEDEISSDEEMIVPVSDESSEVIDVATDALDSEDEEDFEALKDEMEESEESIEEEPFDEEEFEDFDEESFNGLGESYLKRCYENVKGFKTTSVSSKGKKLFIEGIIKFDSGNIKETQFVFESLGKGKFEGYNKQISRGKKTYKLSSSVKNNKLVCESLNYNYRSKNELNESVRVYGTVKRK